MDKAWDFRILDLADFENSITESVTVVDVDQDILTSSSVIYMKTSCASKKLSVMIICPLHYLGAVGIKS